MRPSPSTTTSSGPWPFTGYSVTSPNRIGCLLAIGEQRSRVRLEVRVLVERQQRDAAASGHQLRDAAVDRDAVELEQARLGGAHEQAADRGDHAAGGEDDRVLALAQRG